VNCVYLDCSRSQLSIGLLSAGEFSGVEKIVGRHDTVLLPALTQLLGARGLVAQDLDQAVVVNGPGSFTGLRIAVSCIHALDAVKRIKVLAIDQLSLLATSIKFSDEAILDAKMNELYLGRNLSETGLYQDIIIVPRDQVIDDVPRVCHDSEVDVLPGVLVSCDPNLDNLRALSDRQLPSDWIDGAFLTPRYVRNKVNWKPLAEQPSKLYDR